jgi:nicotinamide-nucleotide amidase
MTPPIISPTCEIITIGTELLLGQIIDTNTTFLAKELNKIGISIHFRTAVGDDLEKIKSVVKNAAERCDMVITTGGLGPTLDDLTREAVSKAADTELEFRDDLMEQIKGIFQAAGFQISENNRRQAFVPAGSEPISNPVGTAPGFIAYANNRPVICLPGVPRELQFLLANHVIPWLRNRFQLGDRVITYKVLKTAGIGESKVDQIIGDLMAPGLNPQLGLLASTGEIRIRITATANSDEEAERLIHPVEMDVRSRLGDKIFGEDEDTLEGIIDTLLLQKSFTLAIGETFSGGLMSQRFHSQLSSRLICSIVIPAKKEFIRWLGRKDVTSELDMARNLSLKIKETSHADIGLASIGFPKKKEDRYILKAIAYVVGDNIDKHFVWESAGELPIIIQRGVVNNLNTLRLALLEKL